MHNDDENHPGEHVAHRHDGTVLHAANAGRIDVRDLLQGRREVLLVHKDSEYRLRVTSNDKLILTK